MRRSIYCTVVAVALAGPAAAADMAVPFEKAPPPVWTWSGCYLGLNGGYAWGRDAFANPSETAAGGTVFQFTDFDFAGSGGFGGGQIGCNWQSSQAVVGIEADVEVADIRGRILYPSAIFANFPSATFDTKITSEVRYFGTVRGRVGWSFTPSAMLYLTGGFAYGEVASTLSFPNSNGAANSFIDHARHLQYGWAAGAGAEALVTPRVSVKAEYLYVDLGARAHGFLIAGDTYSWSERVQLHSFKLGVNFLAPWANSARY